MIALIIIAVSIFVIGVSIFATRRKMRRQLNQDFDFAKFRSILLDSLPTVYGCIWSIKIENGSTKFNVRGKKCLNCGQSHGHSHDRPRVRLYLTDLNDNEVMSLGTDTYEWVHFGNYWLRPRDERKLAQLLSREARNKPAVIERIHGSDGQIL